MYEKEISQLKKLAKINEYEDFEEFVLTLAGEEKIRLVTEAEQEDWFDDHLNYCYDRVKIGVYDWPASEALFQLNSRLYRHEQHQFLHESGQFLWIDNHCFLYQTVQDFLDSASKDVLF